MSSKRSSAVKAAALAALVGASGALAAETEVRLTRRPDRAYEVSGLFTVDASTTAVWGVLMDYEHIPSFVASMRKSRVRETRGDGSFLVEQEAAGGVSFLSRTVRILLEVSRRGDRLQFTDVGRKDFRIYDGGWEVRRISEGADVAYHLLAQPRFHAPAFLVSRAAKRGARDLLDQVRAEVVRRELAR